MEGIKIIKTYNENGEPLRLHTKISEKAYGRLLELLKKEPKPVSPERMTQLADIAEKEFPLKKK
jgi:hypothetical protein